MQIEKAAVAGTLESSDCMVTVEDGDGNIDLVLESTVIHQYGNQIPATFFGFLQRCIFLLKSIEHYSFRLKAFDYRKTTEQILQQSNEVRMVLRCTTLCSLQSAGTEYRYQQRHHTCQNHTDC